VVVFKKSGIINFLFHDIRHTFASHLVMMGVSIKTVHEIKGLKKNEKALRNYHISPERKTNDIESLGKFMYTF
jgi:site-specific recombinase XerD